MLPPPPARWADAVVRFARHIGRRGAYLLFLCLLDLILAYSLLQALPFGISRDVLYHPFIQIMPLRAWALWWAITGVLAGTAAVVHALRPPVFALAAGLKTAWASGYVLGWLHHEPAYVRGYQTGVIFGAFALITVLVSGWRENQR